MHTLLTARSPFTAAAAPGGTDGTSMIARGVTGPRRGIPGPSRGTRRAGTGAHRP